MKYKNIIMMFALIAVVFNACNRDEIFEREMYKARVALKGNTSGGFNIFEQEHDFDKADASGWTEGFISANVGGALPTTERIVLTISEDMDLLNQYNQINFSTDDYKYARLLSKDRYQIKNREIVIPAGERGGIMPISFKLEGLSPDSMYTLPFKVEKTSAYELNLDKSTVLYRIHFKNFWSTTRTITEYSHRGSLLQVSRLDEIPAPTRTPTYLNKRVYPVSRNEIRLNCGTKSFNADDDQQQAIPKYSMRVMINDDGTLTIEPWSKEEQLGIDVKQVHNDNFDGNDRFLNTYELVDDGFGKLFRTFRLCYDYTNPDDKGRYRIWEELRLEYRPLTIQ